MHVPAAAPTNLVNLSTILRWIARLASLVSLGILLMFAFGENGSPTPQDWLLMMFFPFGLAAGLLVGWWRELLGGAVTLASLAIFYVLIFALRNILPGGPYFFILSSPGALFLAAGILKRCRCATRQAGRVC